MTLLSATADPRLALAIDGLRGLRREEKVLVADVLEGVDASFLERRGVFEDIVGRRLPPSRGPAGEGFRAAMRDLDLRLKAMSELGIGMLRFGEPGYPALLAEIDEAPFILYYRGSPPPPSLPCAAVVGTRYPTGAGLEAAWSFGSGFAAAGMGVVSGLARGIDGQAHRGALDAGGLTWAVLGHGPDTVHPAGSRALAARILDCGGGLLSEYGPGEPPLKYRYPERNRIISGLCQSVVVVEAPEGSGALITAGFALDQGRELFVAAGLADGPRGAGLRELIADGAPVVASAAETLRRPGAAGTRTKVEGR